jgi:small subunit ribosomal protein S5e
MHGWNNGKKLMTLRIIKNTLEITHLLTNENLVQIMVDAAVDSGPREDSTRSGW